MKMNFEDFLRSITPPVPERFTCTEEHVIKMKRIRDVLCPEYDGDAEAEKIYLNRLKYFTQDPTGEWNLNKGLYLYGVFGVGKTLFFKVFRHYLNAHGRGINSITADELVAEFSLNGFAAIMKYSAVRELDNFKPYELLIDDLGQGANNVKHYGSYTDVMVEILQRRYRVFTDAYKRTFISTNLQPSEIKDLYGEYISSRMQEMFNIVLFPGTDKRKSK
jgi:DNA replication protein DnaC